MPQLFYHPQLSEQDKLISLLPETARHIVQVLRMEPGNEILLTNGVGLLATAILAECTKKECTARIIAVTFYQDTRQLTLAVAFTKNTARNEWLLEKAAELGVKEIIPLQCLRGNRDRIKEERVNAILLSAMLQSQQVWLAGISAPLSLEALLGKDYGRLLMAHCNAEFSRTALSEEIQPGKKSLILIGPEGDFTREEITLASRAGAIGISLGATRLRTETAAIAACSVFQLATATS